MRSFALILLSIVLGSCFNCKKIKEPIRVVVVYEDEKVLKKIIKKSKKGVFFIEARADFKFKKKFEKKPKNKLSKNDTYETRSCYASAFIFNKSGLLVSADHLLNCTKGGKNVALFVTLRIRKQYVLKRVMWHHPYKPDLMIVAIDYVFKSTLPVRYEPLKNPEFLYTIGFPSSIARSLPTVSFGNFFKYGIDKDLPGNPVVQLSTIFTAKGSSGGPVFDAKGRVVGMIRAIGPDPQNGRYAHPYTQSVQLKYLKKVFDPISL